MENDLREVLEKIGMEDDVISIMVDVISLDEIKFYYSLFGWELKSQKRDKVFHKTYHLEFKRDHFIKNKDKLQKYEVEFESNVKELNRLKLRRHRKSAIFSITGFLIGMILAIFGVLNITTWSQYVPLYVSIIMLVLAAIVFTVVTIFYVKILKKENIAFDSEFSRLSNERSRIFDKTMKLRGDQE